MGVNVRGCEGLVLRHPIHQGIGGFVSVRNTRVLVGISVHVRNRFIYADVTG